jgi:hypothetical protein
MFGTLLLLNLLPTCEIPRRTFHFRVCSYSCTPSSPAFSWLQNSKRSSSCPAAFLHQNLQRLSRCSVCSPFPKLYYTTTLALSTTQKEMQVLEMSALLIIPLILWYAPPCSSIFKPGLCLNMTNQNSSQCYPCSALVHPYAPCPETPRDPKPSSPLLGSAYTFFPRPQASYVKTTVV